MTKKEFKEMTFEDVMDYLTSHDEGNEVCTRESLLDYAIDLVKDDNVGLARHILDGVDKEVYADFYLYDATMGTLDSIVAIESKEDVQHLFDFEEGKR